MRLILLAAWGLSLLCASPAGAVSPPAAVDPLPAGSPRFLPPQAPPAGVGREFATDWTRSIISFAELLSGGPPKDGIPAIDRPRLDSVQQARSWLRSQEPVVLLEAGGETRIYPLQILMWHEIVNDTLGGVAVAVTFCPLCNSAIAFRREAAGRTLSFGTTGRLRFSNLLMYDRQTESWWQQATGEAVVGAYAGARLPCLPAPIRGWRDAAKRFPGATVLSRDTGHARPYGSNPYAGYDDADSSPFLFRGPPTPGLLRPMDRVITVQAGGEAAAYPYEVLRGAGAVNDTVGGVPVLVLWADGVASALDAPLVAEGRDVGTAVVFARELDGRVLDFWQRGGRLVDTDTGSEWDEGGQAVSGPLRGAGLAALPAVNHFWFSWAAFRPDTRIYTGAGR